MLPLRLSDYRAVGLSIGSRPIKQTLSKHGFSALLSILKTCSNLICTNPRYNIHTNSRVFKIQQLGKNDSQLTNNGMPATKCENGKNQVSKTALENTK